MTKILIKLVLNKRVLVGLIITYIRLTNKSIPEFRFDLIAKYRGGSQVLGGIGANNDNLTLRIKISL